MTERARPTFHAVGRAAAIGALTAAACAPAITTVPATTECVVVDDAARPHITIGVAGAGTPGGRVYSAAGIASAQMYETLVRVDCEGSVTAGLADTWVSAGDREWRFRMVRGASFADGAPVTAQTVALALSGPGAAPVSDARAALAEVTATGEYALRVSLHAPADVRLFAKPELAITRPADGLPVGTSPFTADPGAGRDMLRLTARRRPGDDTIAWAPRTIDVRTFGSDLRTAIDAGVDIVIAGDASTVAYARARTDYNIEPLPWSRTYVLATLRPTGDGASRDAALSFPEAVVGISARPAQAPFWWRECKATAAADTRTATNGRVFYARDDETARAIAERITALARDRAPDWLRGVLPPSGPAPTAVGVSAAELLDALRSQTASAVVTSMPRIEYAGCAALDADPYGALAGWHTTPLIDTRMSLIYRPGIGRVVIDGDGSVRFGTR